MNPPGSLLPELVDRLTGIGVRTSIVLDGDLWQRVWDHFPFGFSQIDWDRVPDRLTLQLTGERGAAFRVALREHALPWLAAHGIGGDVHGQWLADCEHDALALTLGDVVRGAELLAQLGGHHYFVPDDTSFALCLNSFDMLALGRPVERDEQLALQREVGADGPRWAAAGMAAWTQPRRRSQAPGMLAKLGAATQAILEARGYDGVALGPLLDAAMAGTRLYRPGEAEAQPWPATTGAAPTVEVTEESTLAASRRLTQAHARSVVALNFASARNPGGGWLGGARAQEESLARASGLVPCLESQPTYYEVNRRERSLLYSDHLIYSPDVPVFRDDAGELLPAPWTVAFITSPAPNCGALRQNQPASMADVPATLARRVRQVLKVAALHGHRVLVLGAWGCGAFRCDPHLVAKVFAEALAEPEPRAAFEHVTFAIKGGHEQTLPAFRAAFED